MLQTSNLDVDRFVGAPNLGDFGSGCMSAGRA